MALEPTHVVVAGTGAVYVAPEGTTLPTDLAPLATPWEELGFVGEDGVTFTFSRETEDVTAWQSSEPVRILTTSEPKTIEFELLEFDRATLLLAFRGGDFAGTAAPWTYTPPDPGSSDVRALTIDGVDGDETFRFSFPRVQLGGDLEFALLRTDAVRFAMELSVLASAEKWKLISDLVGLDDGVVLAAFSGMTRAQLDQEATAAGLDPSAYSTKEDLIAALEAQRVTA